MKPTEHFSEIGLLGLIAIGIILYMVIGTWQGKQIDVAACLVVLTAIVSAIKERWTNRSLDRMGQSLANAPPSDPPATGAQQ